MENNQPIIIKRVKRFGGGHHGGAWKIAFADFATAMMAFFLVLWLMSSATPEQKIAIAGYFKDPIGFSESGTPYIIDLGGSPELAPEKTINPEVKSEPTPDTSMQLDKDKVETMAEQVERERLELLLQELQNKVEENPELQKFKDQILFEITQDGLRIQIMDAENRPMFALGSAQLQPYFEDILLALVDTIAAVLADPARLTGLVGEAFGALAARSQAQAADEDAAARHLLVRCVQAQLDDAGDKVPGTRLAILNWPPISLAESNRVT